MKQILFFKDWTYAALERSDLCQIKAKITFVSLQHGSMKIVKKPLVMYETYWVMLITVLLHESETLDGDILLVFSFNFFFCHCFHLSLTCSDC